MLQNIHMWNINVKAVSDTYIFRIRLNQTYYMKINSLNLFSYDCFLISYYLRQVSLEDIYISIINNVN